LRIFFIGFTLSHASKNTLSSIELDVCSDVSELESPLFELEVLTESAEDSVFRTSSNSLNDSSSKEIDDKSETSTFHPKF
jgi:hypothetical protein